MSSDLLLTLRRLWFLFLLLAILQTLFSLWQTFFGKNNSIRQWAAGEGGKVSLCMTAALAVYAYLFYPRPERSLIICAILGAFGVLLRSIKYPGYQEQTNALHHPAPGRWVTLTPMEINEASRKRQRGRVMAAVLVGSLTCGPILLSSSDLFAKIREEHSHPPHFEPSALISHGLPRAVLFGLIGVYFYFLICRPGKSKMICTKCGAAKWEDGASQCKCGGHFEDMNNVKWEE
jgi:hypothetical protein